jgi:hypothetical protein
MRPRGLVLACVTGLLGGCTTEAIQIATVDNSALTDQLIAYWPLDEDMGAVANDMSNNGHTGALQGPAYNWVGGQFGSAVHFSGADLMTVAMFPKPTPSFTVSAWTLITNNELGPPIANIISTEIAGGGWALFANLGPGPGGMSYEFEYATTANPAVLPLTVTSNGGVITGTWTHLAAVLDGDAGSLTLYVAAAPVAMIPAPSPIIPGSPSLNIGRSTRPEPGAAFPMTGAVDDVAIYGRALTLQEIGQLNAAHAPDPNMN